MNAIAERYSDLDVGAIFLYTNKAHLGKYYLHLTSLEQKFKHAKAYRDILGVTRPIMVDALDGACHRAYGSMPNMSWIFTRSGVPVYKSDWTDSHSIQNAVEYFLKVAGRRRAGEHVAPLRIERLDFHIKDQQAFYDGLERNGPKALREFLATFP